MPSVAITPENPALTDLKLSWSTAEFTAEDGIGPLNSLHEAGDALVAIADRSEAGLIVLGSGVMVGPGLLVTATHVLSEFQDRPPVCLTFLPSGVRAWLPVNATRWTKPSAFDDQRTIDSDICLISCSLNSEALAEFPLTLAPMQVALPLIGERLWATGFQHQAVEDNAALVTPLISSGLVTAAYPNGRGEFLPSPCFEVNMDTVGGMSGGAVVNADGYLVGILSSSFEGGPSYVTLIWDALRLFVKGAIPKLQLRETVSLLGARTLGLVRIKGDVSRNPWGDLNFKLSDEENRLLSDSEGSTSKPGLNEMEREEFMEVWYDELARMGCEATINGLARFSLQKLRGHLGTAGIPDHCLDAIQSFSVEEFEGEGAEDLELISTEIIDPDHVKIEYFFQLQSLIWTVEVSTEAYRQHTLDFREHFFNETEEDTSVKMELLQRCYFRAETVFDRTQKEFSDVIVTSSAIRRPPAARPPGEADNR